MKQHQWFCLRVALLSLLPVVATAGHGQADWRKAPLVREVREATAAFRDVRMAEAAGYVATACASGGNEGAMGIHYVNPGLLFNPDGSPNGEFEVSTPEVLMYEPLANGSLKLIGVEYIVFAEPWDEAHSGGESPVLNGQLFHFSGAPNRYRLPAFYELHVWAWKKNANGTFADWNPHVSCAALDAN